MDDKNKNNELNNEPNKEDGLKINEKNTNDLGTISETININTNKEVIEGEIDESQTSFIQTQDLSVKNEELSAENLAKKIQLEKRQELLNSKRAKREKFRRKCYKSVSVASCVLALGVGIGAGYIISNDILEQNRSLNFKFDVSDVSFANNEAIFTSATASNIFNDVGDSVVNISIKADLGAFNSQIQDIGSGSGIIYRIDEDTVYIITNNHVIEGAEYVTISVTGEEQVDAKLVGTDPTSDLAVLSVSKKEMQAAGINEVSVAEFANSDLVEVGDFVFPIGNALGLGKTMTQGVISAQNKEINIDGKDLTVLQTDAAINPGNSGGALMDAEGKVIGVNTAKLSNSAIEGIGYAIPSNVAVEICDQIIENGFVERPYLGVVGQTITETVKEVYSISYDGVLVIEVEKGSNADNAGLKSTDIITSFGEKAINTVEDLSEAIKQTKIGDTVTLDIIRNGTENMQIKVKLEAINPEF